MTADEPAAGLVRSVNVGLPREVTFQGRQVMTSIWKAPVAGRVAVRGENLDGDRQSDLFNHGGEHKAVYAYAWEDLVHWAAGLGREPEPGLVGENLTLTGQDVTDAVVGERWRVGSALLEVSQPRFPCFKLGLRVGDRRFVRTFGQGGRPGAYLRIVEEGDVGAGDAVTVVDRPAHGVTVGLVARAYHHDRGLAGRVLAAGELAPGVREWAAEVAARHA